MPNTIQMNLNVIVLLSSIFNIDSNCCLFVCSFVSYLYHLVLKPPVVIEKPEIEAYGEQEQPIKTDVSTSPIPFLDEKIDELNEKVVDTSSTTTTTTSTTEKIECKSTQTATKSVVDSACMTTNDGQDNSKVTSCTMVCQSCGTSTANSYSSIKFYTSLALAGLFAFFFAVTQFSPDIHKTYTRPPPI